MSTGERLDKVWRERGLAAYSTAAILGTLRHYGVDVDEARLKQVFSRAEALALGLQWRDVWKGLGPFADLPYAAAIELWRRLGAAEESIARCEEVAEEGSPPRREGSDWEELAEPPSLDPFFQHFEEAPLEEKLALARKIAESPDFDVDDAFELGSQLQEGLRDAGRIAEFDGVLGDWEARAPEVYYSEAYLLAWRVECALVLPGSDVRARLLTLVELGDESHSLLMRLIEWCLFRGRTQDAWAGLSAAWPAIRENEDLLDWAVDSFRLRCVYTALDVALLEERLPSENQLRERLKPFEPLAPGWFERAMAWRMGLRSRPVRLEGLEGTSREALGVTQHSLLMGFGRELESCYGWPLGRSQLLHPWLLSLLPERPSKAAKKRGRPADLLLPEWGLLRKWALPGSDARYFHSHGEVAAATALRPWGEFLHRQGFLDEAELTDWRRRVSQVMVCLPKQFMHAADPFLAEELRQAIEGRGHASPADSTGPSDL